MNMEAIAIKLESIDKGITKLDKTIATHNGRLGKMEEFVLLAKGGKMALKGLWSIVGVFFVAMAFGMFQMYVGFTNMDSIIKVAIHKELAEYEFNLVE